MDEVGDILDMLETVAMKWLLGGSIDQDSISKGHAARGGTHWQESASPSSDYPLRHIDPSRGQPNDDVDSRYPIRFHRISGSHSIHESSCSRAKDNSASVGMGQQMERRTDRERYVCPILTISRTTAAVMQKLPSHMLRSVCLPVFVMAMP